MEEIDKKILEFVDELIKQGKVENQLDFCFEIKIIPQQYSMIKTNEKRHFSLKHIQRMIDKFDLNPNFIFSKSNEMFVKKADK